MALCVSIVGRIIVLRLRENTRNKSGLFEVFTIYPGLSKGLDRTLRTSFSNPSIAWLLKQLLT